MLVVVRILRRYFLFSLVNVRYFVRCRKYIYNSDLVFVFVLKEFKVFGRYRGRK